MNCSEFEKLASLYAADELEAAEREAIEQHAASCAACASVLAAELKFAGLLHERKTEDPSPGFLAQCRGELSDRLDDAETSSLWARVWEWIPVRSFMVTRPAWTAAFCILFGIALGVLGPRWLMQQNGNNSGSVAVVPVSDVDLQNSVINGLSLIPVSDGRSPNVELQYTQGQPRVLRGTLDDSDVRRVLIFIAENNQRFDSGMRMDSLEALRTRTDDVQVREVFCFAARNDRNPSVRLKALEALRGFEGDPKVRSVMLDALLRDENPGARVEAIDALRAMLEKSEESPDDQVVKVLQDRMRNDSNAYIRLQSAAAVRQIAARYPR
jgi:hypothetical protein